MNNVDNLLPAVKSEELSNIKRTFLASISRVEGLLILPGLFVFNVLQSMIPEKGPEMDAEHFNDLVEKGEIIVTDRLRWAKEDAPWEGIDVEELEAGDVNADELFRRFSEVEVQRMLNEMYFGSNSKLYPVGEGLLYSAAVMTWTAVEYAAKDAWISALNARPKALSSMIEQPRDKTSIRVNREFSLTELSQHNFDLHREMGSLLSQKFRFSTVSGILEAYEEIIGIDEGMRKNFDKLGLRYLECLRHLIVHRGGIVDELFLRRTKTTKVTINQRHPITDQNVSDWLDDAFSAGEAVLTRIENWLSENPE
jgi:hypothetical protein